MLTFRSLSARLTALARLRTLARLAGLLAGFARLIGLPLLGIVLAFTLLTRLVARLVLVTALVGLGFLPFARFTLLTGLLRLTRTGDILGRLLYLLSSLIEGLGGLLLALGILLSLLQLLLSLLESLLRAVEIALTECVSSLPQRLSDFRVGLLKRLGCLFKLLSGRFTLGGSHLIEVLAHLVKRL